MEIVSPSDFKLRITSITDTTGNVLSPSEVYLYFVITARYGKPYECVWTKNVTTSKNIEYDSENDTLYLIVENYDLKGQVSMKVGTAIEDTAFKDGMWNWWAKEKPIQGLTIE